MPSGPSHSAGHSFSGGGSHSGGFSSSYGSGGSTISMGPRTIMWFGRPVVVHTGAVTGFIILIAAIFFSVIISFICYSGMNSVKKDIAVFEKDAVEYEEIIKQATATTPPSGYGLYTIDNINFEQIGSEYHDDVDDWVYVYNYESENFTLEAHCDVYRDGVYWYYISFEGITDNHVTLNGDTYTQYSQNSIKSKNSFAIAYKIELGEVIAINADYSLDKNQNYLSAKSSLSSSKTIMIIALVIAGGCLIGAIFVGKYIIKKAKESLNKAKAEAEETKAKAEESQAKADAEKAKTSQLNRTCVYCGSKVPDGADACPACGSRKFK